ncbi:hypothetical protein O181_030391 [Austropuccinia psidii MF-1]|uniref:Uncharacterized protein n=1 Tax=Austropuccinia psidii MF-1 TaxID=1389203 RepID=A0A9Q3H482_9BASI|nr:hypothetical protein [Austropuccinia psidii MF-1]
MSHVHLRRLAFKMIHPQNREGLFKTRRHAGGHLGHSGRWQEIGGNHMHSTIYIPIQQKPQTRGSLSSAPPTPQRPLSMEHGQQEVQSSIPLGRTYSKLPEDMSQRDRLQRPYGNNKSLESHQEVQTAGGEGKQDKGEQSHYPSYRRTADPDRAYSDYFRLTRRSFQEKTRIQGQKQDLLQPKAERVRPNHPKAVGLGERSTQEPEIAVHTSTISSLIDRNITPTQIEHSVATPVSNLNHDALWLHMSQFAEKTQKPFAAIQASHKRKKSLTGSMDKIVKTLQEDILNGGKVQLKDKPRERVPEVTKKNNSCHNCGSKDNYANKFPKANKKVYAIEKVPEEEFHTEDSESNSMVMPSENNLINNKTKERNF